MEAEKQKAIELALSKLTQEEKELLGLIKKEVKPKIKRHYNLKIYYMIGDADGYTDTSATIDINNPFVKIFTNALDNLCKVDGHWGITLEEEQFLWNLKKKNISNLEYDLLCLVRSYDEDTAVEFFKKYNFENTETNRDYLEEFEGLLISEIRYSFLVYQSYKLK